MQIYKIRNKTTGLYSTGGSYPSFSKKGKAWNARGHVTSHLSLFNKSTKKTYYEDCEVVCFEVQEITVDNVDVLDWSATPKTIRAKQLEEQRLLEYKREQDKKRIEYLERELSNLKQHQETNG
jgi:hypothetical protein